MEKRKYLIHTTANKYIMIKKKSLHIQFDINNGGFSILFGAQSESCTSYNYKRLHIVIYKRRVYSVANCNGRFNSDIIPEFRSNAYSHHGGQKKTCKERGSMSASY